MNSAQLLLRRLLEQAGGVEESSYLLVLDGEGLEDLPEKFSTSSVTYAVHRVDTELGLRHLLWKARGAPLIAVLPRALAEKLRQAPDILRRARAQRIHGLTVNDVLEVRLGARVVGADAPHLQKLAIDNLERLELALSRRTLPTVVDRRLLSEMLVDAVVGEKVRTATAAQLLATWVTAPPDWKPEEKALLRDALPALHGDEGQLLAWALDDPPTSLQALVVYGTVLTVEAAEVPKPAWGPLWRAAIDRQMDPRVLRRTVAALAEATLRILGDSATPLLIRADRVAREQLTSPLLQTSRVLPLSFSGRCDTLAKQAAAGKTITAADIGWLTSHLAAAMHRAELAVLEAIARVTRYLDQAPTAKLDILKQIEDYQRDGAFADLAMLHLRRTLASSAQHHTEAKIVLATARERRDRDNRQFAETLAGGYEAALHREGVTPLHRLWKRVVAPVWEQDRSARLFLVVMDGCSYPVFLELLYALERDSSFALGIKADADGRAQGLPALAPLPTVTSHARGAIFLGELPEDPLVAETVFRDVDEAKTDKARFNQNEALAGRTRKLFLKGDLGDGGQSLRAALADVSIDVVGVVFNAVDDQIGSTNTGAQLRLRPEDIDGFTPALQSAVKAGRRVLLTADHGHTPYLDKGLRVGAGKTPRYLALGKRDAPPEGFLEIDVAGLGGPRERRAFAWRSGAYLGGPQVGFHGGCSLEEMVVPLAWLERDGQHANEPSWWYGGGMLPEPAPALRGVEPPLVTPHTSDGLAKKPTAQMSLFDPAEKAPVLPLPAALLESLTRDQKAVLVLLHDSGSARASELATRLQKNPGQLNRLMANLRKVLHDGGHPLFGAETLPDGETMYRYLGKEKG